MNREGVNSLSKRTSMKQLADELGVSVMTVSRALSNKPDISEKTRQVIIEKAREVGYEANLLARGLRTKKTKTLGIIVTDISNMFFISMIKGIESEATKAGYSVLLASSHNDYELEKRIIKTLSAKYIDGIIITPIAVERNETSTIDSLDIPAIIATRTSSTRNKNFVIIDDFGCGYKATEYLISQGHRRILFLFGPMHSKSLDSRLKGYEAACKKHSIDYDSKLLVRCDDVSIKAAYEKTMEILKSDLRQTAILTYNDYMAIGVINALNRKQVEIPKEMAVMGMDGIELGEYVTPSLTTIAIDSVGLGKKACKVLIKKIEYKQTITPKSRDKKISLMISGKLLIRESA